MLRALVFLTCVFCVMAVPAVALAQLTSNDLGFQYATELGLSTTDIRTTIARIVNIFFGLLGTVAVLLILYAGFVYMTSQGNPEKIDIAKRTLTNAVIGLIIILSAYAITAFIINAITGANILPGVVSGVRTPSSFVSALRSGPSHHLGNGILEYHYPERGQVDVPRNTKISLTFKKPLVLSTVFADYDAGDDGEGNPTYALTDDTVGGVPLATFLASGESFRLNTDNIKIIDIESLGEGVGASPDERFDDRYPDDWVYGAPDEAPTPAIAAAAVTPVEVTFDTLGERQTLTITLPISYPLGSATTDVDYRVALRGGESGIAVFAVDASTGEPSVEPAFDMTLSDGGYYWNFRTGTTLDLTPPRIKAVIPRTLALEPGAPLLGERDLLPRNQLLQIYFDEPVDPTSASGEVGGGFSNVQVEARCISGRGSSGDCVFNGGNEVLYAPIPGTIKVGNAYRTAEYMPSEPCEEGVSENSCGDTVYCLPKFVEIRVRTRAASLAAEPPTAARLDGVVDMANNSLDGNGNRSAEGPPRVDWPEGTTTDDYNLNVPQGDLEGVSDTARWIYQVGQNVDLVPPAIVFIDPLSEEIVPAIDRPDCELGDYECAPHLNEKVPTDLPVTVGWSKVMSPLAARSGMFDEEDGEFVENSNVAIRTKEMAKLDYNLDCTDLTPIDCPADDLPPPFFFLLFDVATASDRSIMSIEHRDFLTANDLGYTEDELNANAALKAKRIPLYHPVIGAQVRDARQNCFYPSEGYMCGTDETVTDGDGVPTMISCCNRNAVGEYGDEPIDCR